MNLSIDTDIKRETEREIYDGVCGQGDRGWQVPKSAAGPLAIAGWQQKAWAPAELMSQASGQSRLAGDLGRGLCLNSKAGRTFCPSLGGRAGRQEFPGIWPEGEPFCSIQPSTAWMEPTQVAGTLLYSVYWFLWITYKNSLMATPRIIFDRICWPSEVLPGWEKGTITDLIERNWIWKEGLANGAKSWETGVMGISLWGAGPACHLGVECSSFKGNQDLFTFQNE